jgi:ketose-bisphosphate aldolase
MFHKEWTWGKMYRQYCHKISAEVQYMLVNTKEILDKARKEGYAVPAFNITDMQSIMTVVKVCEEENAPCLIEAAEGTIKAYGTTYLAAIAEVAARKAKVPVALHLDHGKTFEIIIQAIRDGFSSVMIDASQESFDENVRLTRQIVDIAHACGVSVEAELGHVGVGSQAPTQEDLEKYLTKPEDAKRFVELTNVDFLAVAVGTAHGLYTFEPKIDLERLKQISETVDIPLVIHGGSGTPGLEQTPPLGVSKVNVFTDLQIPIRKKVKEIIESEPLERLTAVRIWKTANEAAEPVIRDYLRKLGASGKA